MGDVQWALLVPLSPIKEHCAPLQPILPKASHVEDVQFIPGWHFWKHGSESVIGLHASELPEDMHIEVFEPFFPMREHWAPSQPILPKALQFSDVQFIPSWQSLKHGSESVIDLHCPDIQCDIVVPFAPIKTHDSLSQPILPMAPQIAYVQLLPGPHFWKHGSVSVIDLQVEGDGPPPF